MIRYTQKNVHSLFNGEDDVDEDGKRKKKRERKCLDFLCILYKFYFMREIESFLIVVLVINQKPLFRDDFFIKLLCDNLDKCAKI